MLTAQILADAERLFETEDDACNFVGGTIRRLMDAPDFDEQVRILARQRRIADLELQIALNVFRLVRDST